MCLSVEWHWPYPKTNLWPWSQNGTKKKKVFGEMSKISFKTPQHSKNYYFVSYELLEMVFITIYNHYFRYHYYGYYYNYEYIYIY